MKKIVLIVDNGREGVFCQRNIETMKKPQAVNAMGLQYKLFGSRIGGGGQSHKGRAQKAVQLIGHERKPYIQSAEDHNVYQCGRECTDGTLHSQANLFQYGDIAGVVICEVGLQNMRHTGGYRTEAQNENNNGLAVTLWRRGVNFQRNDQNEKEYDNVMECHCMEIKITIEEIPDIIRAVDQCGIDQHQQKDTGAQCSGHGKNGVTVFAFIKGHDRHCIKKQRAIVERKTIKIIALHQRKHLFTDFQCK